MTTLKHTDKAFAELLDVTSDVADELGELLHADLSVGNDDDNQHRLVTLKGREAILANYPDYRLSRYRT